MVLLGVSVQLLLIVRVPKTGRVSVQGALSVYPLESTPPVLTPVVEQPVLQLVHLTVLQPTCLTTMCCKVQLAVQLQQFQQLTSRLKPPR